MFDILLDKTFLNALVLTLTNLLSSSTKKERKYQLPVALFDVPDVNAFVLKVPNSGITLRISHLGILSDCFLIISQRIPK